MAGITARLRELLRVQLRTILPLAAVVVTGLILLAVLAALYALLIGATVYQRIVASIDSIASWTGAAVGLIIPLVLLAVLFALVWAGIVSSASSAALDKRQTWMPTAALVALRRAAKALAVIIIVVAATLGALIVTPVLVVIGIVGLIARRGRRGLMIRMAIPFGFALLLLLRWSLALPAVWLDGLGVRAALAESVRRVDGRRLQVAVTLVVSLVANLVVSLVAALLIKDAVTQFIVQVIALILFGALPLVAMTVLYRRGSDERPAVLPAPLSRRARVAVAAILSLIVPLMVGVSTGPAANATPGTTVTLFQYYTDSLVGVGFVLEADVVNTGITPTGQVSFSAIPTSGPAIDLGTSPLDGLGRALPAIDTATLPAGDYQLVATYGGDSNYPGAASDPLAHTVSEPTANIAVSSVTAGSGDAATLTITLTPKSPATATPGGTVTVTGGSYSSGALTVNGSGVASVLVDVAVTGTRDLTVDYSGDSNFVPGTTSYSIPRVATTIHDHTVGPLSVTYGASQTFSGTVSDTPGTTPTGTVQLLWKNAVAETTTLSGGAFSITTDQLGVDDGYAVIEYLGDASHAPSDDRSAPIRMTIAKTNTAAAITVAPTSTTIGESETLTATLDNLGAGPTGTVDFNTATGTFLGSATVVGHTATLPWTPLGETTFITATYSGDHNFNGLTSAAQRFDSAQAPVTVTIADPGPIGVGTYFTLTATVHIGATDLRADHGVSFVTSTGTVLASNLPIDYASKTVSQDFCAGTTTCPSGYVQLGLSPVSILATYAESNTNLLGQSLGYSYSPTDTGTTTSLVVDPTNVIYGSGVNLTATVAATGATPPGSVTFYSIQPVSGGGTATGVIGTSSLVNGVATFTTSSGSGPSNLRWPVNQIKAIYNTEGAPFTSSNDTKNITLNRVGTSITVRAVSPAINVATQVEATLSHDPGASDDYSKFVTFTSDTGDTCVKYVAAGARLATCTLTWTTPGTHSVTAAYDSSDPVYLPSTSTTVDVPISTATHTTVLGADSPRSVLVGDDVTVTWRLSDVAQTGNVTVFGDGVQWCVVDITVQSCTGQFGIASATGGFVNIVLQYDGDGTWLPTQESVPVTVTRCATLDVRGNDSSLGSVSVVTAPNCGATGYRPGTSVTVTGTPIAPAVLSSWLGYQVGSPNLISVATTETTSFTVTTDTSTWVHVAQFQVPCSAITADSTGYGGLVFVTTSNCTTADGAPGFLYGTKVTMFPNGNYDPGFGEADAFRSFGTLPAGVTTGRDSTGGLILTTTVTVPLVIPITFGPQCHSVVLVLSPAQTGNNTTTKSAQNCFSPFGDGYLRYSKATVTLQLADSTLAIASWSLNGVAAPQLGTTSSPTVFVDNGAPVLTANLVHCYLVDAKTDNVTDTKGRVVGDVTVAGEPNCPDGSKRYLAGTTVTLSPVVLVAGGAFNGWDATPAGPYSPAGGTGVALFGVRSFPITADVHTTAGFYLASSCSRLTIIGPHPELVGFDNTGCGPGYYNDLQKQVATSTKVPASTLWQDKYHDSLKVTVDRSQPLDVYVSIKGDTRNCFGQASTTAGPATDIGEWKTYGPISDANSTCGIAGDVSVWPEACETLTTSPVFTVAGDSSGATYDASVLPGTMNLEGPDGLVGAYSLADFPWAQSTPLERHPDGSYTFDELAPGPCHDSGKGFPAGTAVSLKAVGPATGFTFNGWTGDGLPSFITANPVKRLASGTQRVLSTTAYYTIKCYTIALGEGISTVGDVARCPGTSESDNSYIAGTAIEVKAAGAIGDRQLASFSSGVVAGQIYKDDDTLELTSYAVADGDKSISATYLTAGQNFNVGLLKGLKIGAGVFAVAAPIVLSMAFPPLGIGLAVLGVGAGLSSAMGLHQLSQVFDLINPANILVCAAKWSFSNTDSPTGGAHLGSAVSLANLMRKLNNYDDVLNEPVGAFGAAGGIASFGIGLWSAGIANVNLGPTTIDSLADTNTMTSCLNKTWQITGADVGTGSTQAP